MVGGDHLIAGPDQVSDRTQERVDSVDVEVRYIHESHLLTKVDENSVRRGFGSTMFGSPKNLNALH